MNLTQRSRARLLFSLTALTGASRVVAPTIIGSHRMARGAGSGAHR